MMQSEFGWSTDFQLPQVSGGYLQEGQQNTSIYRRTSMEGGYWYRWILSDLTIGEIALYTDEEGLRGYWRGHPEGGDVYDVIEFSYSPMTISTIQLNSVPEPGTIILFASGLSVFVGIRYRAYA
jgi:hypothetical protein